MWACVKARFLCSLLVLATACLSAGCPAKTGPTAVFSATPESGNAPLTVQFTDQSLSGSSAITAWQWTFGDGRTSTTRNPTCVYPSAGTYLVALTVTTDVGSNTSPAKTIVVLTGEGEGEGEGESDPLLSVTPVARHVLSAAADTTFDVSNNGGGSMEWNAAVASGEWMRIASGASGVNAGTIVVEYDENTSNSPRSGTVTVTATGVAGSPFVVNVGQAGVGSAMDWDGDTLSNDDEDLAGSDPRNPDTDADGLSDGNEVHDRDTSPIIADTDGDAVSDGDEIAAGTDPLVAETAPPQYKAMAAAINGMTAQIEDDASTMPFADTLQHAADYLAAQPNVSAVHFDAGKAGQSPMLWADFTDYATYVVLVAPKTSSSAAEDKISAEPPPAPTESAATTGVQCAADKSIDFQGFPQRKCAFANLFDAGTNSANTSTLFQMMKNKKYNAELITGNAGGVHFFKNLANYGVVYLDSHGGFFEDTNAPAPHPNFCVLRTSDARSTANDTLYFANGDFASRRVTISTIIITSAGDLAAIRAGAHYCVTNEFINRYVGTFEKHSIVYLNCCQTAQLPAGSIPDYSKAPLFSAFLAKNAGAVLGWTESVGDEKAMKSGSYFFSRMLGDNDGIDPQNPPIRPYDFGDTFAALQHKGYSHDTDPDADLVAYIRGFSEDVILAPRINFLVTDIENEEMELHGDFGANGTPTVKAGDQELTVKERDTDTVLTSLDPRANGPVTVTILDHVSNAVPLTQWSGTFDLQGEVNPDTGPRVTGSIKSRFRADIHSYRDTYPEDEAQPAALQMASFEYDSVYTYDFTSTFVSGDIKYEYTGSGSVHQEPSAEGNTWLGGNVMIKSRENLIQFIVYAVAEVQVKVTNLQTGDVQNYTLPYTLALSFEHPIGQYGAIGGGAITLMGTNVQATWSAFEVMGAPDDKTPAS